MQGVVVGVARSGAVVRAVVGAVVLVVLDGMAGVVVTPPLLALRWDPEWVTFVVCRQVREGPGKPPISSVRQECGLVRAPSSVRGAL